MNTIDLQSQTEDLPFYRKVRAIIEEGEGVTVDNRFERSLLIFDIIKKLSGAYMEANSRLPQPIISLGFQHLGLAAAFAGDACPHMASSCIRSADELLNTERPYK